MKREVIVFIILLGVFLAIGCTESNSEGVNVSDTSTTGEDMLSTEPEDVATTAGEMTNIVPRTETEADRNKKTQDVRGTVINNQGEVYGTIGADQLPATIWMDSSMSRGVVISDYRIDEQGNARLNLENIGIEIAGVRVGATFSNYMSFDPQGPGYHIWEGYGDEVTLLCPNGETPKNIVIEIKE